MNPALMFTEKEVWEMLRVIYDNPSTIPSEEGDSITKRHGAEMHRAGWLHAISTAQLELIRAKAAKEQVYFAGLDARLAGCDTAKQAPASAGVNSPEFFVCADPTCGKVGDIDDGHGNEYIPGPYCQECWDAICAENPILTESYDC